MVPECPALQVDDELQGVCHQQLDRRQNLESPLPVLHKVVPDLGVAALWVQQPDLQVPFALLQLALQLVGLARRAQALH